MTVDYVRRKFRHFQLLNFRQFLFAVVKFSYDYSIFLMFSFIDQEAFPTFSFFVSSVCHHIASISIFPHMQVSTVQSFAAEISRDQKYEGWLRASCFVLLQLVNALKNLQARGIEEGSKNLGNLVLCREDKDTCYRLYMLQG